MFLPFRSCVRLQAERKALVDRGQRSVSPWCCVTLCPTLTTLPLFRLCPSNLLSCSMETRTVTRTPAVRISCSVQHRDSVTSRMMVMITWWKPVFVSPRGSRRGFVPTAKLPSPSCSSASVGGSCGVQSAAAQSQSSWRPGEPCWGAAQRQKRFCSIIIRFLRSLRFPGLSCSYICSPVRFFPLFLPSFSPISSCSLRLDVWG